MTMLRRLSLIAALIVLLLPVVARIEYENAAAVEIRLTAPTGDTMLPRLQEWAAGSAIPTADTTVEVEPSECPEGGGVCTIITTRPFRIYFPNFEYLWGPGSYTESEREASRLEFLHELGHAFDFSVATHIYRAAFLDILHLKRRDTMRALTLSLEPTGWMTSLQHEKFAMAYSYCAAGLDYARAQSVMETAYWGYGYRPTASEYARICSLLGQL